MRGKEIEIPIDSTDIKIKNKKSVLRSGTNNYPTGCLPSRCTTLGLTLTPETNNAKRKDAVLMLAPHLPDEEKNINHILASIPLEPIREQYERFCVRIQTVTLPVIPITRRNIVQWTFVKTQQPKQSI